MAKRLNGGGDPAEQVQALRERIGEIRQEIAILESASRPVGEAVRMAQEWVQARASEFQPITAHLWARTAHVGDFGLFRPGEHVDGRKLESVLCAVMGDQLIEHFRRRIEAEIAHHGGGIADGERAQRLAELRAELRRVEIAEEQEIEAAEARGITIDRREDASAEIFLGLWRLDAA